MNEITMKMQADELIMMALREDITSEDVSTNAVMPKAQKGTVDLIAKEDGVIAGLQVYARVFTLLDDKTEIEIFLPGWRRSKERTAACQSNRRYPCASFRRTCGSQLSSENERNCHLYKRSDENFLREAV